MQKLKFINGNGVEIDLTDKVNFGIIAWEGFSADGLNIQSQQVPFQDGGVFLDALMEQRELSVTVAINAKGDLEKRYRLRRELISVLNPKLGEGVLIYTDNYLSKQIHVIPQIPLFDTNNSNDSGTPKVSCSFTACNPYWEDLEDTVVSLSSAVAIRINNNGDVPINVELKLIEDSVKNPSIQNTSNNKTIKILSDLSDNVTIKTLQGKKSANIITYEDKLIENANNIYSICFNREKNKYSRIQGDIIQSSIDGINYYDDFIFIKNLPSSPRIFFEKNVYIIIGSIGTILTSADLINWTQRTSGVDVVLKSLAYSEHLDMFIIIGSNGTILTSSDLINWTQQTSGVSVSLNDVICKDSTSIIVGNNGTVLTSADLINWTQQTSGTSQNLNSIFFAENSFISAGNRVYIYTTDTVNWISYTCNYDIKRIGFYKPFSTVIGLVNISESEQQVVTLENYFSSWQNISLGTNSVINDMMICDDKILFVGNNSTLIYTVDLSIWNKIGDKTKYNLQKYTYDGEYYYFTTGTTYLLKTKDFNVFTPIDTGYNIRDVIYIPKWKKFFAVLSNNKIISSDDVENWIEKYTSTSSYDRFFTLCYCEKHNVLVCGGGNGNGSSGNIKTVYTNNGDDWTTKENYNIYSTITKIIYVDENDRFYAVGLHNSLMDSDENFDWGGGFTVGNMDSQGLAWNPYLKQLIYARHNVIIISSANAISVKKIKEINIGVYQINNIVFSKNNCTTYLFSSNKIISSTDNEDFNIDDSIVSINNLLANPKNYQEMFVIGSNTLILKKVEINKENIISKLSDDSDMNFNLNVGENLLFATSEEGNFYCNLLYRQKYIGV